MEPITPIEKKAMDMIRKITNELSIAEQPTLDELQQLAAEGYRSVVNLRSSHEVGFLKDEQQQVEGLGLSYVNFPIRIKNLDLDKVLPLIQQLVGSPQPMLVHCDNGIRSSIVVLIRIATEQGIRAEDAFEKVVKLDLLNHRF